MSEAVPVFGEGDSCLTRLTGDVLVAIQDYLRWERGMATDFNGDMPPVRIQNVKGVVINIWHRLLFLDVMVRADIPHRCLCSTDQNQKQSVGHAGLCHMFLGNVMLTIAC